MSDAADRLAETDDETVAIERWSRGVTTRRRGVARALSLQSEMRHTEVDKSHHVARKA